MTQFKFQVLEWRGATPQEWVQAWADRYDSFNSDGDDQAGYEYLIKNYASPSKEYFERMGQWKDDAYHSPNKWRNNVASVAYEVWKRAAEKLPRCPKEEGVASFLDSWAKESYTDRYASGSRTKRFGLSRATALLHFISGGKYPILDSRVRAALTRLCSPAPVADASPENYLKIYCPLIKEIAVFCGVENEPRKLDKALFSYGAFSDYQPLDLS